MKPGTMKAPRASMVWSSPSRVGADAGDEFAAEHHVGGEELAGEGRVDTAASDGQGRLFEPQRHPAASLLLVPHVFTLIHGLY